MRFIPLLLSTLLISSCVTAGGPMLGQAGREPTDEELVQDFLTVAFREGGNADSPAERPYLIRFHDPIRVLVHGNAGTDDRARIEALVAQMREVTGHDIAFAKPNEPANYHVHMLSGGTPDSIVAQLLPLMPTLKPGLETEMRETGMKRGIAAGQRRQQGQLCMALHYPWKHRPDLATAHTLIDRGMSADRRMNCLAEEMLQMLGLPGDTNKAWPSRFSERPHPQDPSEYDWLYVRLLHDAKVRAGMTKTQVRPIALRRVAEWRANGKRLAANADNRRYDPQNDVPSNELLLDRFMAWALGKESSGPNSFGVGHLTSTPMFSKWETSVNVLLTGSTDQIDGDFANQANQIAMVTGVNISRSILRNQNVHIHVERVWDPQSLRTAFNAPIEGKLRPEALAINNRVILEDNKVYSGAQFAKALAIRLTSTKEKYYYFLGLRVSSNEHDNCYRHGLFTMMGGGRMVNLVWPSRALFTPDCSNAISSYDLLLLRILYDGRIRSGMPEAEAQTVAREILSELRPDETHPPEMERLTHPGWRARQAQARVAR